MSDPVALTLAASLSFSEVAARMCTDDPELYMTKDRARGIYIKYTRQQAWDAGMAYQEPEDEPTADSRPANPGVDEVRKWLETSMDIPEGYRAPGTYRKVVVVADLHGCPDRELTHAIIRERPDVIVVGGDLLDSKSISEHPYNPNDKGVTLKEEMANVRAWLELLLARTHATIEIMHGNHDWWLTRRAAKVLPPEILDFIQDPLEVLIAGLPSSRCYLVNTRLSVVHPDSIMTDMGATPYMHLLGNLTGWLVLNGPKIDDDCQMAQGGCVVHSKGQLKRNPPMFSDRYTPPWQRLPPQLDVHWLPMFNLLGWLYPQGTYLAVQLIDLVRGNLVANGCFTDLGALANLVQQYGATVAVYVVPNPVYRRTRDRINHLYQPASPSYRGAARRCLLPIRFTALHDPDMALARALLCRDWLISLDAPPSLVTMNGLSVDLLFRVDLAGNTNRLIQRFLIAIALRYNDPLVAVNSCLYRDTHLLPLYGTRLDVAGCRSTFLPFDTTAQVLPVTVIQQLADTVPEVGERAGIVLDGAATTRPIPLIATGRIAKDEAAASFLAAMTRQADQAAWTPVGELYRWFRAFCHQNGLPALPVAHFGRWLVQAGFTPERRKVQGEVVRGFQGIRLDEVGSS